MLGWILLIALVLLLIGTLPVWPYSRKWGYWPGVFISLLIVVVIIMFIMGLF